MNARPDHELGPHSRDSVVLFFDGPIDDEIRPCDPSRLPFLKAESEKLKRYQAMMKEREAKNNASEKE